MPQITLPARVVGRAVILIDKILINSYENKSEITKFSKEYFQSDIKEIDWPLATDNDDVDLRFKTF